MERVHVLHITEAEYQRLIKLVQRDEKHRIKNRENARKKAVNKDKFSSVVRGPVKFKLAYSFERLIDSDCPLEILNISK